MTKNHIFILFCVIILFSFLACTQKDYSTYTIPVEYQKLNNGLRVVLSQDATAPIVTVAVYYKIGFRIEPRNRTGFAHLFEHMMFQGSKNLGKMEFIKLVQSNGGVLNGSTRFDFTDYFEIVPSHKLETMLWAEADRMRGLKITKDNLTNQQGVVTNEVKVNVLNQPYGGFPWLDMPQYANENWFNAHNFYGDLKDIEAASLENVQKFFDTYYSPNNAVVVISGDFESAQALGFVDKYFGDIPQSKLPEPVDISEPRQETEKIFSKDDKLATKPALAFAYHVPERLTPEYFAMGIIDQILLQGEDSWLYQSLVQKAGITDEISGGINALLGNMYDYNGPMLWTASLIHDKTEDQDSIVSLIDLQIDKLRNTLIDKEVLNRALIKIRASYYNILSELYGFGRVDLLACFALFNDNPQLINTLEDEFRKVTPELIQRTAREYLRTTNRTILKIIPKAKNNEET